MARKLQQLRNFGIVAHIDAGKTTVTERMLFYSGAKHRVGAVDSGTTDPDDDPEEQDRGITIYSACLTFDWRDVHVNLLDTPGHVDFTAEVERCLRVLDGAVVVFSAREGVEAQSETVWRQADKYKVPRLVFINKLDREGADFFGTFEEIRERLDARPVALQLPVGAGPPHTKDPFTTVIDLVSMKQFVFDPQRQGPNVEQIDIPESLRDEADLWREKLLDTLAHYSDEITERVLAEEHVPESLLRETIREATLAREIQPVLCGSALGGTGIRPLLDAVAYYLPSPLDVPPVEGIVPQKSAGKSRKAARKKQQQPAEAATARRRPQSDDPFAALVFKVLPAKTGDLYWVRVYSGELKANSRVYNPEKDIKENVSQLWQIHATKKEQMVTSVGAGDIVGLIGPKQSVTGDTLCDAKDPIVLEPIEFPETVLSMAIEPESATERKKLAEVLAMLQRQDPTFDARESEETGQTIISGMGELHLEVIKHRLLRDFNLDVKVHKPRVSYRETIEQTVEVTGECHRQISGQQLFAQIELRMQPHEESGQPVEVDSDCPDELLPEEYLDAAVEEVRSRAEGGGLIGGFPLSKLKVTVTGGRAHEETSSEIAFRIAAGDAFEKGLREGRPVLLEPIMRLSITTPEEYLGDFVGDLQQRRATITRTTHRGKTTVIEAQTPLSELFGYSSAMRSISQGRAGSTMEPLKYAPAPAAVAETFMM